MKAETKEAPRSPEWWRLSHLPPPNRWLYRSCSGLLAGLTLWLVILASVAACMKAFALDEFYYAHVAWKLVESHQWWDKVAEGGRFVAPYVIAVGALGSGDEPSNMIFVRLWMLPLFWAVLASIAGLSYRRAPTGTKHVAALASVFFALSLRPLAWQGLEIRPDLIALLLFLSCLWLMELRKGARRFPLLAGLLLFLATFASVKALVYGAPLALFFLTDQWAARRENPQTLGNSTWFASGFILAGGVLVAALAVAGDLQTFWDGFYQGPRLHQESYPRIPVGRFLRPFLRDSWLVLVLSGIGCFAALTRTAVTLYRERSLHPQFLLVVLACSTTLSYTVQKAAYPYSLMPACALFAILAGLGTAEVLAIVTSPHVQHRWMERLGLAPLVLLFGLVFLQSRELLSVRFSNAVQIRRQAQIGKLTSLDDKVFDMSATYYARHGAFRMPFIDNARIALYGKQALSEEITKSLVDHRAMLFVYDVRFHAQWRNTPLAAFIDQHYQPYNNDLYLWGRRWPAYVAFEGRFDALKSGRYFVHPPDAARSFQIDGQVLQSPVFSLAEGGHIVRYSPSQPRPSELNLSSTREVYMIWLPRDGQPFDPTRRHPPFYLARFVLP